MVIKTCQADDALEKQFEGWLKQQGGPEVGVLVGKYAGGAKVILYGTIKTPSQEGLDPILVDSAAGGAAAAGAGAGKGGGKKPARAAAAAAGSVAVTLESEWIVEHARQVSRMLPGGLSVLGLYLFASEPAAAAASPQLASALGAMGAFCLPAPLTSSSSSSSSSSSAADAVPTELLLLHVDSGSRKQALRAIPAAPGAAGAGAPSGFHPCELKYAPALGSLVCVRCWHGIDVRLTVGGGAGAAATAADGKGKAPAATAAAAASMRQQLAALLAAEAERVRGGVFVTGDGTGAAQGVIPAESAAVGDALAACAAASGRGIEAIPTYDLTLLAPLPAALPPPPPAASTGDEAQLPAAPAAQSVGGVYGQARLGGCLQGVAFVSKRDSVGRALAELKADLLASLGARVDLLVEEALRSAEAAAEQEAQTAGTGPQGGPAAGAAPRHPLLCGAAELAREGGCDVPLPRRVLLPWLGGGLALCDYLLEGEPAEAAAERAAELLALAGAKVLEAEQPAAAAPAGPWQPTALPGTRIAGGGSSGSKAAGAAAGAGKTGGSSSSSLPCSATALVSMAVAALAGAVGLMSMSGQAAGGGQ